MCQAYADHWGVLVDNFGGTRPSFDGLRQLGSQGLLSPSEIAIIETARSEGCFFADVVDTESIDISQSGTDFTITVDVSTPGSTPAGCVVQTRLDGSTIDLATFQQVSDGDSLSYSISDVPTGEGMELCADITSVAGTGQL